ncbi:MAG: PaaX domain-containing protein, C- domain protein [Actinomycetota bacterium]|nr:PaaX domain-containing protein, C- domain protein [Actinomycetota bacterium]
MSDRGGSVRPFTARSVLASALLGADPPELPVAHLVHLAGLFGINANRARVALSRMCVSGEATTDGAGHYRLSGPLEDRRARQVASRAGATRAWTGAWLVVIVTSIGRDATERTSRRRALAFARLAELREGVWMRPENLDLQLPGWLDDVVTMTAHYEDGAALADRLWTLTGWSNRATELLGRLDALPPCDWTDLAPGFALSADVLRHLQADPLLPRALLPNDWPGMLLRRRYDNWDRRYRAVLRDWGRAASDRRPATRARSTPDHVG